MLRACISPSLAALVLALLVALTAREAVRERPLNVVILTVESWRADTATPENMPNLFAAARAGATFGNHRAISAWTAPNTIAVLTGLSSFEQGLHTRGRSLPAERETFPEQMGRAGWRVAGLQAFMRIPLFANLGLEIEPGAAFLAWLAERARVREPFFLWHHYLDTHLPYDPAQPAGDIATDDPAVRARQEKVRTLPVIPDGEVDFAPSDAAWIEALYLGGVREFDEWFGGFWSFFEASGLRESTILVVTADHGEERLERGHVGHASTTRAGHLHEEIVHIPLFVWAPHGALPVAAGTRVAHMTDHRMIAPAIADMLGRSADGVPGLWRGDPDYVWEGLTSVAGFAEPDPDNVTRFIAAARKGSLKVQVHTDVGLITAVEGWDLSADPGERHPLSPLPAAAVRIADVLARKMPGPESGDGATVETSTAPAESPGWVHPAAGGRIGFADIADAAFLSWTGDDTRHYVLQYEAGSGLLRMAGEIAVGGTRYDFGRIDEGYWRTWVVPYGRVRFRVRPVAAADGWSDWIELELGP